MNALLSPLQPVYDFETKLQIGISIVEVCVNQFDVAFPFYWVSVDDNVEPYVYYWNGITAQLIPVIPPTPSNEETVN